MSRSTVHDGSAVGGPQETAWLRIAWPGAFSTVDRSPASETFLREPAARKLVEFFERKGLAVLKREDQLEQWYEDWIAYQAQHGLYASVLSPRQYSATGRQFDLLRYARFLEVFGYFSPSHAYSLQVTFLGLFSILMGTNDALKAASVALLEAGSLFAFGISEKQHGSDLFANEFTIRPAGAGRFVANGSKYYIGNANCAAIISTLGRKVAEGIAGSPEKRDPFVLVAIRPGEAGGVQNVQKIRTIGVRGGFVGSFDVKDHELSEGDIIAEGRNAWDAVLGTVTLGKFFSVLDRSASVSTLSRRRLPTCDSGCSMAGR